MDYPKIHCSNIPYRSGFLQVRPNIHPGHVNVEIWSLHPAYDRAATDITDKRISDAEVTGNTEIELDAAQARELVRQLTAAINSLADDAPNRSQEGGSP